MDRKNLYKNIKQVHLLAFRMLEKMSNRIREAIEHFLPKKTYEMREVKKEYKNTDVKLTAFENKTCGCVFD